MEKVHWKKLTDTNYIGAYDLQEGQELKINIEGIERKPVMSPEGQEKMCVVATIKGAKKGMILNKTNMKIITKVLGSPYIEDWVGKSITIYSAKVKAFGEMVDGLRVKNQK